MRKEVILNGRKIILASENSEYIMIDHHILGNTIIEQFEKYAGTVKAHTSYSLHFDIPKMFDRIKLVISWDKPNVMAKNAPVGQLIHSVPLKKGAFLLEGKVYGRKLEDIEEILDNTQEYINSVLMAQQQLFNEVKFAEKIKKETDNVNANILNKLSKKYKNIKLIDDILNEDLQYNHESITNLIRVLSCIDDDRVQKAFSDYLK